MFDIHDRGYVYVQNEFLGIVSREHSIYELSMFGKKNQVLSVVAESEGRICYGPQIKDFKVNFLELIGGKSSGGLINRYEFLSRKILINILNLRAGLTDIDFRELIIFTDSFKQT